MNVKEFALILVCGLVLLAGCNLEQRQRLELLSAVQVTDDNTIYIRRAQGVPFILLGPDGKSVESVRIQKGQEFVLSDRYHVCLTYRFRKIKDGSVIFVEKKTEDTRSMGGSVKTKRRVIAVKPYKVIDNTEQENSPDKK